MYKKIQLLTLLLLISSLAFGQSAGGEIFGKVTDEKNQPLEFASVQAIQGDITKGGGKTNLNGVYKIKPLSAGTYSIKVSYAGYPTKIISNIDLGNDRQLEINVKMEKGDNQLKVVTVKYVRPLISASDPGTKILSKEEIKHMPSISTGDFVSNAGGTYQRKSGDNSLSIGGDRSSGTMFMIDGIMIRGSRNVNLAPGSINTVELMSNGLSAKYGNATGGFPVITTKGIDRRLGGSINYQRSFDGYNNNLLAVDLSGPLLKIRRKGDSIKTPLIGFSLNAAVSYDKDNNPSYLYYRLKPETLKRLEETPLLLNPNGNGIFVKSSELTTDADFERIRARENGQSITSNIVGKLDFQPTSQISVRLGTVSSINRVRGYNNASSLFAPNAHSYNNDYSLRNYILLTHNLGKSLESTKKDDKKSAISNAYYSIQFTYQKDKASSKNPIHKDNIFDYGYIGKFVTNREDIYFIDTDSLSGFKGQKFLGQATRRVDYTPGGKNPLLENYSDVIFNYAKESNLTIDNLTTLQGLGGLRNGDGPGSTYGLFSSPGAQVGGISTSSVDRATVNIDASLDIEQGKRVLGKSEILHTVQFGLGYDQSTNRFYNLGASSLWGIMRQLTNRHILNFDYSNPIYVVGGQNYTYEEMLSGNIDFSTFDTIKYNRLYDANTQARFDKSLRSKLYGNEKYNKLIDIDAFDPSTFTLDMFSADDLINQGNDVVFYGGHDYLGNKLKKQPSFNDFWTKKDARGDYTRPVAAFQPIYMYGYVLDRFRYKNLNFNIGLRVDRYDANQKVLKDPYSLYGVLKTGDIKEGTYKSAKDKTTNLQAPAVTNFSKDYVVYVDNNQSSLPTVVGYRKGDVWYDPFGKEIQDPSILSGLYAGGLPIQPWLLNKNDSIKSSTFNPNNSFEDYKPQVSLSPRIQFTFPISEHSLLYGNYDVVTQQPSSNSWVTPDDYYFLKERQSTINNANLRMEKGINYALGFQQELSKTSALTIEANYRERRDQIQLQRYFLAYPVSYLTYGNRDFSATTSTMVKLEFRRPKNKPVRLDVNYTLQFAEGTGSNTASQRSLIASGQPNLRTLLPLNIDSRHMINASIDYRYGGENMGPKMGKYHPFNNTGLNINFRTRSGEPYTRFSQAIPLTGGDFNSSPIVGTPNGSRLPWNYEINLRLDKNIVLKEGDREKGTTPKVLNVYTYMNNVLNTRNRLGVYGYTGLSDDDAYLSSPQGIQALSNIQFQDAYVSQYNYSMFNANNFNNPRRIYIGFLLDF